MIFQQSKEEEALDRWSRREFLDLERTVAKVWRKGGVGNTRLSFRIRSVVGAERLHNQRGLKNIESHTMLSRGLLVVLLVGCWIDPTAASFLVFWTRRTEPSAANSES